MKKHIIFGMTALLMVASLSACGTKGEKTETKTSSPVTTTSTTEEGPKKSITISNITLSTQSEKAYITVTGNATNYSSEDFTWAWGLMNQSTGEFDDGKEIPAAADYKKANLSNNNSFTLRYCLTDIKAMKAGALYRIYGGTPESYNDIPFQSNNYGAKDAERNYYLRQDQDNSLIYDSIQPIKFTKASVVELAQTDLPTGVTNAGAYLKFGGTNAKNYTIAQIDEYKDAGKIEGNFQRVIGDGYQLHNHSDEERFYKIEGNELYFYLYVGFIEANEGWMLHFDMVGGSANAGLTFENTLAGETPYTIGGATYKLYADKNKSGEENYWGCLGVFRSA